MNKLPRKKKSWGQHFLHEQNILHKMVKAIDPSPLEYLVEIGPGDGALTKKLLPLVNQLTVIEIDKELIPVLKKNCDNSPKLKINLQDVLLVNFADLPLPVPVRLVGNLPYNISTPLLFRLVENVQVIQDLHFMLQKEVAERITAQPGSKIYGRLSVMMQYYFRVGLLFPVGSGAFTPAPKVDSAVVRFIPHQKRQPQAVDEKRLSKIVASAFNQRRKTIANSLKKEITPSQLKELGIDPKSRPEQLTVSEFVKISNLL